MKVFQDFQYAIRTSNTHSENNSTVHTYAEVHSYIGTATKVTIPSLIEGFPVVVLHNSFLQRKEIEEIILPNTLEEVSSGCFLGCENLKKIHLPASMKKIGRSAFEHCTSLAEVTLDPHFPDTGTIEFQKYVFHQCPKLYGDSGFIQLKSQLVGYYGSDSEVTLPHDVITISDYAFLGKGEVTVVNIPDSVTSIGICAFQGCRKLEDIHLPTGLTVLNNLTFKDCKALERIVLPDNLRSIGYYAFSDCSHLKDIQWGNGLKTICMDAFSGCTSLEEIHFPEGLEEIGVSAFARCSHLKEIHIPASVTVLCEKSFEQCDDLEHIVFAPRDEWIHPQENRYCYTSHMRALFIEKGIELSQQVVLGFSKTEEWNYRLDQVTHWDRLSKESQERFRMHWKKKISSKLKAGKNVLRNMVFLHCTAKEISIYFQEGGQLELPELEHYLDYFIQQEMTVETALLLDYKNKTFDKAYLDALQTRKEMIELGLELPSLKELREKWHVKVEEDYLKITGYQGKNALEFLPEAIETGLPLRVIGTNHKFNAHNKNPYRRLKKIDLPEGMVEIEATTFSFTSLQEISLPSTLRIIGEKAFWFSELKAVTILEGFTVIEADTFMQCLHLVHVNLPNTIQEIKENAFLNCVSMTELVLPSALSCLGAKALSGCRKLEEITLPATLNKLGDEAFSNCSNLKRVILEDDILEISPSVFKGCSVLEFVGTQGGENLLHPLKKE